ncbi:uncharacterized protein FFB20_12944 [Fusarium fujikuroi]|jgi:hypothetical protein
MIDF